MNYLVIKYLSFVSAQLRNFKKKSDNLYNFSCPYCGDSKRNPRRARGDVFEHDGTTFFKCHKCGKSRSFDDFLNDQDASLFREYIREKLFRPKKEQVLDYKTKAPEFKSKLVTPSLCSIKDLPDDDAMKQYVLGRKIPENRLGLLFKCPNFRKYTNDLIPNKFSEGALKHDEERLVIPFLSESGDFFGFAGRSLDPKNSQRYINIILDENVPHVFGLERWDKTKTTIVLEGPLDALFLENSLATLGNDMVSSMKNFDKENLVFCYDNEPRHPETKKKIEKAIKAGYKVVIWPRSIQKKDINAMILGGLSVKYVEEVISSHTFQGLRAQAEIISRNFS